MVFGFFLENFELLRSWPSDEITEYSQRVKRKFLVNQNNKKINNIRVSTKVKSDGSCEETSNDQLRAEK